ncbi:MAG: hydroxymethylbilane synthase [Alphaproteobacteria bacterium]
MKTIKIGTRGSPLAMTQTRAVEAALKAAFPDLSVEIVEILTSGDWKPSDGEVRLSEAAGGKGQFASEIEAQLLSGEIDAAVHSMKDMDSFLPDGLVINHMMEREDPRDCLLFADRSLAALAETAIVGTASVRRAAFLLADRPDLKIVPFRGNVQTRIDKIRGSEVIDCTLLALAGLKRLGLEDEADIVLSVDEMLPAAGQGAVGIETREDDGDVQALFDAIACSDTLKRVQAERAALAVLDGSCHTPIGAHAVLEGAQVYLRVKVVSQDGAQMFEGEGRGEDSLALGVDVGAAIKARLPDGFLA